MRVIADIFLLLGASFCFLAALGLIRMPDVYNRIQVGTKSATLGTIAIVFGVGLLHPEWWSKLVCIAGFILFTSPVSSSTIARSIYKAGIKPWQTSTSAETSSGDKS